MLRCVRILTQISCRGLHEQVFICRCIDRQWLLVSCNQLTQYTITEQEINQSLAKHNNFSKDISLPGVADAHIVLTNLLAKLVAKSRIRLPNRNANLDMNSLFGSQKATMKLKLKARCPCLIKKKARSS